MAASGQHSPRNEAPTDRLAYRAEVLAKAIGRLRAIPVTCTALTGAVWYGTGWNDAITALEEIAEYQTPDDEAYPGELQRLRALALAVRVAIRKDSLPEVSRVMDAHVAWEASATNGEAAADFFQPGHTYAQVKFSPTLLEQRWMFKVVAVADTPGGQRTALGFLADDSGIWAPHGEYELDGWTDVTETAEVTA
ncbi:hypothetical protein [Streptomyces sp. NPDC058424]|uniref:hypothetical protein n=1 Tax=Streptomyces sp. NPDC058424 TaxID=3346491 RepID=UPI00365B04D9